MSTSVEFRSVTDADLEYVAKNMRQADVDEIWAASGVTPDEALTRGIAMSDHAVSMVIDNQVATIFGVVAANGYGVPWALGTPVIDRFPKTYLKACRVVVKEMQRNNSTLKNCVHVKNQKSVKFLKLLGFSLSEPVRADSGEFFYPFEWSVNNV